MYTWYTQMEVGKIYISNSQPQELELLKCHLSIEGVKQLLALRLQPELLEEGRDLGWD